MGRTTTHVRRPGRLAVVVLLALVVVAALAVMAPGAMAKIGYLHGTAQACSSCHSGTPTSSNVTNAACAAAACHNGFATSRAALTCWNCHNPGQDMSAVVPGAPTTCTTVCHLADSGAEVPNSGQNPHPSRGLCTQAGCHDGWSTVDSTNGDPHHTALPGPVQSTITLKVTPKSIKLGKFVAGAGVVGPVEDLFGDVIIKVEIKKGARWSAVVKLAHTPFGPDGKYKWNYKPKKKGSYRMTTGLPTTDDFLGCQKTAAFTVK